MQGNLLKVEHGSGRPRVECNMITATPKYADSEYVAKFFSKMRQCTLFPKKVPNV